MALTQTIENVGTLRVTHVARRMYVGGRWYGMHTDIVSGDNYAALVGFNTYVSYGDNSRQWFYGTWQYRPSFASRTSSVRFIRSVEVPF